jgi:hypothetical protein
MTWCWSTKTSSMTSKQTIGWRHGWLHVLSIPVVSNTACTYPRTYTYVSICCAPLIWYNMPLCTHQRIGAQATQRHTCAPAVLNNWPLGRVSIDCSLVAFFPVPCSLVTRHTELTFVWLIGRSNRIFRVTFSSCARYMCPVDREHREWTCSFFWLIPQG